MIHSYNKENFKLLAELNTRYETEEKEREIKLLTKDQQLNEKILKQNQLFRWGLISGLVLLFILIISIFTRYRFEKRANVLLKQQKEDNSQKLKLEEHIVSGGEKKFLKQMIFL